MCGQVVCGQVVCKLCVDKLCGDKLCVSKLCVGGGRAGRSGQAEVHNQNQEPHKKMLG